MATVLDLVRHYQHAIEKYPNDEQKVLKSIDKLFNLDVTVQHLQETGVGRTVNALRKETGEVGHAARALVYKWKMMVAAEESDQEGDHNTDTTTYNGHENGRDSDDNVRQQSKNKYEHYEKTPQDLKKEHRETNGNYSGGKRKHQSSEEEEPDTKKSRGSGYSNNHDDYKRKSAVQVKKEPQSEDESDYTDTEDSESDASDSSRDERHTKIKQEIKQEPTDNHKSSKHSSSHKSSEHHKKESSSSKQTIESEKHSKRHHSTDPVNRHSSEKSSSKEKSHSSHKHKSSKEKDKYDKNSKSESSLSDKEKKHKEDSKSSSKHKSSSDKYKSVNSENSNEKHKSQHDKHSSKTEKHRSSSQSQKSEKEKHKSSSEKEVADDKHKSKHSSNSKDKHSSSSKEKTKDRTSSSKEKVESSKESHHSHKSDKKQTSSSDSKSKHSDSKHKSEKQDEGSSETKSKHKSSSSSSHKSKSSSSKSKEDVPKKKKDVTNSSADSDDGIDCESGASFAEALGMVSPAKPKKKPPTLTTSTSVTKDLSPANLLAPTAKLAPLPQMSQIMEISALPDISPNYKPRPPPKLMPHFTDEEALNSVISSKNQRTKVYSGNKVIGKIPSLYEMCVQILQEHIDALEYTGGVPYDILKPVVDRANPDQLFVLEHYNPYLMEDTDHLWEKFCQKNFRNKQRQEMETWREMYIRCKEEQEHRLKSLTANIRMTQEAKKAPIKQTKMAYVDSVVKPPRNVARKQAQHGTAHAASASPAARVAALAAAPNVLRGNTRPTPSPALTSSFKPKKAPLMQKALQFMRGRKR